MIGRITHAQWAGNGKPAGEVAACLASTVFIAALCPDTFSRLVSIQLWGVAKYMTNVSMVPGTHGSWKQQGTLQELQG